jgi:hypothetical protein
VKHRGSRDICIASGARNRLHSELTVQEVATKNAVTCKPELLADNPFEIVDAGTKYLSMQTIRKNKIANSKAGNGSCAKIPDLGTVWSW